MSIARPDRAFFLIAAACAFAYVSLPRDTAYYDRWYQLFPIAAVVATLSGCRESATFASARRYLVTVNGLCGIAADAVHAVQLEGPRLFRSPLRRLPRAVVVRRHSLRHFCS